MYGQERPKTEQAKVTEKVKNQTKQKHEISTGENFFEQMKN